MIENGLLEFQDFQSSLPLTILSAERYYGTFVRFTSLWQNQTPIEVRSSMSDWVFARGTAILSTSEGTVDDAINLRLIEGLRLKEVYVESDDVFVLNFEDDYQFKMFSNFEWYEPSDSLVEIYIKGKYEISYSPKNGIVVEGAFD